MSDPLTKLAYQTFQQGKSYFALAHKNLGSQLMKTVAPAAAPAAVNPIKPQILFEIQRTLNDILEVDWQDAERGVYPSELLFDNPWVDFFRFYPQVWLDMTQIWQRISAKQYQSFAPEISTENYPQYYIQNFHHQTNGYLSEDSANLYDLQVELLFNGAADAMRRRVLAPLKQSLQQSFAEVSPRQIRVLDVACGTGRTLKFIRGMLPLASLFGIDLSPTYLRKANQLLSEIPGELPQLLQANAEEMPYRDNYFHGITNVFLFHELPASARQQVINECFRVLQPGGVLIICDSIQVEDAPNLKPIMENFSTMFHEPYYRHYMSDNLTERLQEAGFTKITSQVHFMSKYLIASKPF